MIYQTAMTKNMKRFTAAVDDLMNRPMGTEGMGLLWGEPGEGKSTAVAHVASTYDADYIRAMGCWTVTSMLGDICKALGYAGRRMCRRADMIAWIIQRVAENPRPLFIDEADYLFNQWSMLDALRDIYDTGGCPIILVGMEDIARRIQNEKRFARRVTQHIEFKGVDMDDAHCLATTVCETGVAPDLLEYLHREAAANIGRMVIGLSRIEKFGRANRLDQVTLKQWGERELFYDQPQFGRRRSGTGR
ncbi:MAG: AAA family ATPase [Spirochaetes bacterium GWB1_59_5]|nr:MAG: AAA family ATPase [Spirochaetes bacterium GWB1_59_5]